MVDRVDLDQMEELAAEHLVEILVCLVEQVAQGQYIQVDTLSVGMVVRQSSAEVEVEAIALVNRDRPSGLAAAAEVGVAAGLSVAAMALRVTSKSGSLNDESSANRKWQSG